jgi:transcription-repair coupling factor (superfamily II helicase)
MLLEYAEGARLYVPLTRLDLVQKYRSSEGAKPALSHLGTAAWVQNKSSRAQGHERHGRRTPQALRRAQNR